MYLHVSSIAFLSVCVVLVGFTGIKSDMMRSSLALFQVWLFASTDEITALNQLEIAKAAHHVKSATELNESIT